MKQRLVICLMASMLLVGCSSSQKNTNTGSAAEPAQSEPAASGTPAAVTESVSKSPDKITDEDKKEVTKLINQQIKMLYKDGDEMSEDDITFAKEDGVITATCTVKASSTEIPATFRYNDNGKTYSFISSDFGKTVDRKETKNTEDEMTQQGSFTVNVKSSVTVTLNVKSGHVIVYAETADGQTQAQIADVNGPESGTYSASLKEGKYNITAYGNSNASFSWRYSAH